MVEEEFKPRQTPSEYERKNSRPKNAIETALKVAGILILGALGVWALLYAVAFVLVASFSYRG